MPKISEKTALQTAQNFQVEASKSGFEWDNIEDLLEKLNEEILELRCGIENKDDSNIEEELGDILFTATNLVKNLDYDAETVLKKANNKFERRYNGMFELFKVHYPHKSSDELTFEEWDALWKIQKKTEK